MFNINSRKYRPVALIDIMKPDIVSQTRYMADSEYLDKFRTQLDVMKSAGGDMYKHSGMVEDELARTGVGARPTATEQRTAETKAKHRFEAALFLAKSDHGKDGRLTQELANDFNKGRDSYLETLTAAYELMLHDVRGQDRRCGAERESLQIPTCQDQPSSPVTNENLVTLSVPCNTANMLKHKHKLN
jgi:hypothetical protein